MAEARDLVQVQSQRCGGRVQRAGANEQPLPKRFFARSVSTHCSPIYALWNRTAIRQTSDRMNHDMELRPNMLPSVSKQSVTQPNSPMENFGRNTLPPAAVTLPSSIAQSCTLK